MHRLASSNDYIFVFMVYTFIKVVLYRDTGSVDPGSGPIFGSVSGSEIHILGIAYAKDTFSLYYCGSLDTEPVSCICIADPNYMY